MHDDRARLDDKVVDSGTGVARAAHEELALGRRDVDAAVAFAVRGAHLRKGVHLLHAAAPVTRCMCVPTGTPTNGALHADESATCTCRGAIDVERARCSSTRALIKSMPSWPRACACGDVGGFPASIRSASSYDSRCAFVRPVTMSMSTSSPSVDTVPMKVSERHASGRASEKTSSARTVGNMGTFSCGK
jgi:hypothetical protein